MLGKLVPIVVILIIGYILGIMYPQFGAKLGLS